MNKIASEEHAETDTISQSIWTQIDLIKYI